MKYLKTAEHVERVGADQDPPSTRALWKRLTSDFLRRVLVGEPHTQLMAKALYQTTNIRQLALRSVMARQLLAKDCEHLQNKLRPEATLPELWSALTDVVDVATSACLFRSLYETLEHLVEQVHADPTTAMCAVRLGLPVTDIPPEWSTLALLSTVEDCLLKSIQGSGWTFAGFSSNGSQTQVLFLAPTPPTAKLCELVSHNLGMELARVHTNQQRFPIDLKKAQQTYEELCKLADITEVQPREE